MCVPFVNLSLNNQVYRVRFVETELSKDKRMAISEYSYNPNAMTRGRYNKPDEHVLYTSTNPRTSYDETISSEFINYPFYLSVWRKRDEKQTCICFLSSFGSCSEDIKSNAGKVRKEYNEKLNQEEKFIVAKFGEILEKNYSHDDEDKYKASSELASCIFKFAECIISPSAKDSEEINITFNKEFTDNSLILDRVYFCSPFCNKQKSLVFRVDKIGIVKDNRVVWYRWHIKEHTLKSQESNCLIQYIKGEEMSLLYPNIIRHIDDWHLGMYNQTKVEYKIELEADSD